ncbi:uncharacterized protein LOC125217722 isoform X1 [Salvia hispanica]|uniref:uncharacterized protein LOC125217722 isoform X1 n=1 Tax=Salvia hispanica TaxID=49212 RepID=UPI0020091700|nr:uncharacterized protein LOC125217722 isoform X1 [Salvia hispanica]
MAEAGGPLDFEFEEPIQFSPAPPKKRKKLIGLDDLLHDIQKEQKRLDEKKLKQKKIRKAFDAEDDEEDAEAALLSECVDKCEKEIRQINGDEQIPYWGIQVFGDQEKLPQLEHPELKSTGLMQLLLDKKISPLLDLNFEKGEDFLEGLLADGWLLHLVRASGCVDKSIATWAFNLMLYSSNMRLMQASCDFWSAIFSVRDKQPDTCNIKIDWLPSYSDLKRALQTYGFSFDLFSKSSADIEMVSADSVIAGPPQNIQCWIKFVGFCCQSRDADIIASTQEVQELLVIIISLFLDRQLVGLAAILHESLHSLLNSFKEEWPNCCDNVAKSVASRLPCNINCLRVVESIRGDNERSKQLRSAVALRFLAAILKKKVSNAAIILRSLTAMNVKDKNCDLFQMYICLSLAENWISFDTLSKDKAAIHELWFTCLRNCSSGISITDLRSYASNVRSKASYLLQSSASK